MKIPLSKTSAIGTWKRRLCWGVLGVGQAKPALDLVLIRSKNMKHARSSNRAGVKLH
jgi:hypothetical protein